VGNPPTAWKGYPAEPNTPFRQIKGMENTRLWASLKAESITSNLLYVGVVKLQIFHV